VGAQPRHSLRIQLVETPRSGSAVHDQPGILEHPQMLRDGGTANRQQTGDFVNSNRPAGELLKDGHAGSVAQSIEAGL